MSELNHRHGRRLHLLLTEGQGVCHGAEDSARSRWDGEGITGTYFAETALGGLGYSGFVYDVYYVFGPEATWADDPEPLVGARAPVVSYADELLADIRSQL